jgi:hypothetical protein
MRLKLKVEIQWVRVAPPILLAELNIEKHIAPNPAWRSE